MMLLSVSSSSRSRGVEGAVLDHLGDAAHEVLLLELPAGEVDREPQVGEALPPASARTCAQAVRSTQRPSSRIRPVSSASGMNSAGEIRPRSAWNQRTSASTADHRAVVQAHLRLVVDHQLAALERACRSWVSRTRRSNAVAFMSVV